MAVILKPIEPDIDILKDYGQYIKIPCRQANGDTDGDNEMFSYYDALGKIETSSNEITIGILNIKKKYFSQSILEKHKNTFETLTALKGDFAIPLFKDNDGSPDLKKGINFILRQGNTFIINKGIWHYAPIPFEKTGIMQVIFNAGTPKNDCYIKNVEEIIVEMGDANR